MAAKFAVMLAVLVAALLAVGLAGLGGLSSLNDHVKGLNANQVVTLEKTAAFSTDATTAEKLALQIDVSNDPVAIAHLEDQLSVVIARVDTDLEGLRVVRTADASAQAARVRQETQSWEQFLAFRNSRVLDAVVSQNASVAHDGALAERLRATFEPIERDASKQTSIEVAQSATLARQAQASYEDSRALLVIIALVAIALGGTVLALLVRAVVPRIRRYSAFASRVADGQADDAVSVSGHDELSDLGMALNEMVRRRLVERTHEDLQAEFAEVMQLTETEEEAHDLLKRQIERVLPGSSVVMLNRNNSADRLQATTKIPADSPLQQTLRNAKPRSCLAVRFARPHSEQLDGNALISCEVCGKAGDFSTCEPLLVGGEVIGSVFVAHPAPPTREARSSIRETVIQAAPVLGNLRNLAIAELRAATDRLTGLPNQRAVQDTLKRMVAQAARTVTPLTALLVDLDHFKQVNDIYGHGRGDEVLAAVGSTLRSSCRESDFVGRAGGEEFLILLPDTGLDGAQAVAENIRTAIASITVSSVARPITASIGIAVLPDHAGDATSLLRHADRALYTAKNNGRNRTEIFARDMLPVTPERLPAKTSRSRARTSVE